MYNIITHWAAEKIKYTKRMEEKVHIIHLTFISTLINWYNYYQE